MTDGDADGIRQPDPNYVWPPDHDGTAIMMVTYNRLELTKRMLNSLFANTHGPYRLIVVDNGSTDGTVEWLKECKEGGSVFWDLQLNPKNMGIAIGRNQCLQLAKKYNSAYLSTVDNDVEFPEDWLRKCVDVIKANPNFAIGLNMEGIKYPLITLKQKQFQLKKHGNLGTACTVFHRELHDKIGYFITEFGLYGEEDADFFYRARIAGFKMGYLLEMGTHFGEGALDEGTYRAFKSENHRKNLPKFRSNCAEYSSGKRPIYIKFG